jgi:hypothetical protein
MFVQAMASMRWRTGFLLGQLGERGAHRGDASRVTVVYRRLGAAAGLTVSDEADAPNGEDFVVGGTGPDKFWRFWLGGLRFARGAGRSCV